MAMKRSAGRRTRRNEEQLIRDLEQRIALLQSRKAEREAKKSPTLKPLQQALKALDKAAAAAEEDGDNVLLHVLADARKPLADYLGAQGFQIAPMRRPPGRRPKAAGGEGDGE